MRAVVQRVSSAGVSVDGKVVSSIGNGLMVLIGIHQNDTNEDADFIVRKILGSKLFDCPDKGKMWSKNVVDREHEVCYVLVLFCVCRYT